MDAISAWALEGAAQERLEADRLTLFTLVVAQVRQAIDKRREMLR